MSWDVNVRGNNVEIKCQIKGKMTASAMDLLQEVFGLNWKVMGQVLWNSGHPVLRAIVNCAIAELIGRMFTDILTKNHRNKKLRVFSIYDIGAKWTQICPLIEKVLRLANRDIEIRYHAFRPNDEAYDIQYWRANESYLHEKRSSGLVCIPHKTYWHRGWCNCDYMLMIDSNYYLGDISKGDI